MDDSTELTTDGTLTPEELEAAKEAGIDVPDHLKPEENSEENNLEDDSSEDGPTDGDDETERPEWLPEQYADEEAFAEAHKNLLTKVKEQGTELNRLRKAKGKEGEEGGEDTSMEHVTNLFSTAESQFNETGQVTEETLAELSGVIPQEYIDRYFSMFSTVADFQEQQVYNLVGGQDRYEELIAWAGTNLTEAESVAFDKAVQGTDFEAAKLAVNGLAARAGITKSSASKVTKKKYTGKGGGGGVKGFANQEEMIKAVNDPRYERNAAYRKSVQERIEKSEF